jgi:hypothetical protein
LSPSYLKTRRLSRSKRKKSERARKSWAPTITMRPLNSHKT